MIRHMIGNNPVWPGLETRYMHVASTPKMRVRTANFSIRCISCGEKFNTVFIIRHSIQSVIRHTIQCM